MQISTYESNRAALIERYPSLAFCFSFFFHEEDCCIQDSFILDPDEGAEVVFILGIDGGFYDQRIKPFLSASKSRRAFFWETDLQALNTFLYSDYAHEMIDDPQVIIRYVAQQEDWDDIIRESICQAPSEKVQFIPSERFQKQDRALLERIEKTIFTEAILIFSYTNEVLFSSHIAKNIITNYRYLSQLSHINRLGKVFEDIPFIICGAGPSLDAEITALKQLQSRALIIAVGSACAALSNRGVFPHVCMAVDPNEEEWDRFKQSQVFCVPFFFSPRVYKGVFDVILPDLGLISCGMGGSIEQWIEDRLGLDIPHIGSDLAKESLSITTMALSLARQLGGAPIILCGVDLAYVSNERYATGVVSASSYLSVDHARKSKNCSQRIVSLPNAEGTMVDSSVHWTLELSAISQFVEKYPDVKFYSTSLKGLAIKGVINQRLVEIFSQLPPNHYDIRGKLHALMQMNKVFSETDLSYESCLLDSLYNVRRLTKEIVDDLKFFQKQPSDTLTSAKRDLALMDLQEEVAYKILFAHMHIALETTILRNYIPIANTKGEERELFFFAEINRWNHISSSCQKYIDLISP